MIRARRPLVRLLGCLGVAIAFAVVAVWIASFRWAVVLSNDQFILRLSGGTIRYGTYMNLTPPTWPAKFAVLDRVPTDYYGSFCHEKSIRCSLLWPLAPAAMASLLLVARRPRRGCCNACGYNLAGVTARVCPECGAGRAASTRI